MIYVDNAATSFPKPEKVYQAMDGFYRNYGANPGRANYKIALKATEAIENARQLISDLFNAAHSKNIVFTFNATDALNTALRGVLKPGDEVITSVLDHNSLSRPLNHLAKDIGIKVTRLEPRGEMIQIEDIKKNVSASTKLITLSHASNVTGWIQPIEDIGIWIKNNTGAYFLVDAAQTAGVLPVDVRKMQIDLLAFTGHKALYGPMGSGGLYVADHVEIGYNRVGGSDNESSSEFHPTELPHKLEAGTENLPGIIGLAEGIRFVLDTGMENLRNKEDKFIEKLTEALENLPGLHLYTSKKRSSGLGILSFTIDGLAPTEIAAILDSEYDIAVRSGLQCAPYIHKYLGTFPAGAVRISPGYFNTDEELNIIISAIKDISQL